MLQKFRPSWRSIAATPPGCPTVRGQSPGKSLGTATAPAATSFRSVAEGPRQPSTAPRLKAMGLRQKAGVMDHLNPSWSPKESQENPQSWSTKKKTCAAFSIHFGMFPWHVHHVHRSIDENTRSCSVSGCLVVLCLRLPHPVMKMKLAPTVQGAVRLPSLPTVCMCVHTWMLPCKHNIV